MNKVTDIAADHAAIMAVIVRETDTFIAQGFEGWANCWVQDERTRDVCVSSTFGATVIEGWPELCDYMRGVFERGETCDMSDFQRLNVNITVSGDLAHVVFEGVATHSHARVENTFETHIMERTKGVWRILYASFVLHGHQTSDTSRLAVNAKGDILCAPDEAKALVKAHPGLQIVHNRLCATKTSWNKALLGGLKSAAQQHGFFRHYRYLSESGRSFRLPLVLGETDEGGVAVCVLFVRDGVTFVETQNDGDLNARLKVARAIFGLSDGQMALASRIVRGDGLTIAAASLGISINTARTHLSRTYVKTGVNSQTALVRTLLSVG